MTQFEVRRGLLHRVADLVEAGMNRVAPSYAPGGIMALEGGSVTMLGLMPSEIRRTKPASTRAGYAKSQVHRGW